MANNSDINLEIGRLILSSKTSYKINNKLCKKCFIISNNTNKDNKDNNTKIIETGKDFISNDIYIKIKDNKIYDNYGIVGIFNNDIKIFSELFTLNWLSNKNFNLLASNIICPDKYSTIRTNYFNPVFVIDPKDSLDHDDGFSLSYDNINYYLDIHIADPTAFININNNHSIIFLNELLKRLNTCYIPNSSNNITHLLPKKLIELSSLTGSNIPAITFKFIINKLTNNITYSYCITNLININNYTYENFTFDFDIYSSIFNSIKQNLNINLDFNPSNFINKFIEIIMLLTNHYISNDFISNNKFFICRYQDKFNNNNININSNFINLLNHSANYIFTNSNNFHFNLNLNNYSHISSPMRRFIDLLNHFIIHNENITHFISNLDFNYINYNYKKYKKISSAYNLFNIIHSNNNIFEAIILDINNNNNYLLGLYNNLTKQNYIINTELPFNNSIYNLFDTFNIQLFYNPHKFINSNFPFFLNII